MIGMSLQRRKHQKKTLAQANQALPRTLDKARILATSAGENGTREYRRRLLLLAILMPVLLSLSSCHKAPAAAAPTSSVTVTISPTTISLNVGTKTTFTGMASGGSLDTITWQVNSVTGGNSTVGTIDTRGTYTAPAPVPGSAVTVAAVSTDDSTVQATATVTVLPHAVVTVSPLQASLAAGAPQAFTATVQGAPTTTVVWEVNSQIGGVASSGFISNTGVYTAPPSPPPGGSVTITAVSQADPASSASATVTLSFGITSLQGSYAFTLNGRNAAGQFSRAGSFTADGAGTLQGGLEDVHDATGVKTSVSFTGSYTAGPDGRGTLTFNDGLLPSTFHIVFTSSSQVQIIGFDAAGVAEGAASLSDRSTFQMAAFNGVYVFDFNGVDSSSNATSQIGEFFADGQGGIVNGLEDVNDNGTISTKVTFTGTYTLTSNGRGTATFVTGGATLKFAFYIVSRGSAKFVETDASPAPRVSGAATAQTPNTTFSLSSLNGNYAFLIGGAGPAGSLATAGSFATIGDGNLTSGMLDENSNGTIASAQLFTGTYAIDSTGRGTATFHAPGRTYSMVFYLTTLGGAVFQEIDSSISSEGMAAQQSATPQQSAFLGSYALRWRGTAAAASQNFAGQFNANAGGNVTAGALDINTFPGSQVAGEALTGTLTIGSNGRGTLALNPTTDNRNFAVYSAGPTLLFTVGSDSGRFAAGPLFKQF